MRLRRLALAIAMVCAASAAAQREPLAIVPERLPDGVMGRAYQARLRASSELRSPRWQIVGGRLPQGITLNPRTGELRGVPSRAEEARFRVRVSAAGRSAEQELTLLIVPPLEFAPAELPKPVRGAAFAFQFQARGGKPPLTWRVVAGALPAGIELDRVSGRLEGNPTQKQQASFTIEVRDRADPAQTVRRSFRAAVFPPLEVQWLRGLAVAGEEIGGSLRVINHGDDVLDVTIIVVAVNEIGKAFALGYQRFDLAPQTRTPEVPFIATLPRGQYTVHADVIGEAALRGLIHRDRLQSGTLSIE